MFLITGAAGQLGSELRLLLKDRACGVDIAELDLTDEKAVADYFRVNRFDAIINCAAYTLVDQAESEVEAARTLNERVPLFLAATRLPILQISTDFVFDGRSRRPYRETDETNPLSVYGVTKRDGENAVLENAAGAIVLRTAWMYSPYGARNFVRTMRRLGRERETVSVVNDQFGSPTNAADLARVICALLPCLVLGVREIYHYSNEGVCTWCEFAAEIMRLSGLAATVLPIPAADYPSPAVRPAYSVLSKEKIKRDFGVSVPDWKESLAASLDRGDW